MTKIGFSTISMVPVVIKFGIKMTVKGLVIVDRLLFSCFTDVFLLLLRKNTFYKDHPPSQMMMGI